MAENLDIGTMINGSLDQTDNQVIEKYYYNNDPAMGEIYGGLYQWDELMSYSIRRTVRVFVLQDGRFHPIRTG